MWTILVLSKCLFITVIAVLLFFAVGFGVQKFGSKEVLNLNNKPPTLTRSQKLLHLINYMYQDKIPTAIFIAILVASSVFIESMNYRFTL
jgi:hypothetical protein